MRCARVCKLPTGKNSSALYTCCGSIITLSRFISSFLISYEYIFFFMSMNFSGLFSLKIMSKDGNWITSEKKAAGETDDLNTLTAINSKFNKWQKNAARNFDSATIFYDHGKNHIQHAWANVHLITSTEVGRLSRRRGPQPYECSLCSLVLKIAINAIV
jgi:hypothetical protein